MKKIFIIYILILHLANINSQVVSSGMTPIQFKNAVNEKFNEYRMYLGANFIDTLELNDDLYLRKLNANFDTLSIIAGIDYDSLYVSMKGKDFREKLNYNFQRFDGSTYYWNVKDTVDEDVILFLTSINNKDVRKGECLKNYVRDSKEYGIWSKMKAIYPFIGGKESTHKLNLKSPYDADSSFRLTFHNSVIHDEKGIKKGGASSYANTYFNPVGRLSKDSKTLGAYIQGTDYAAGIFGSSDGTIEDGIHLLRNAGTSSYFAVSSGVYSKINYITASVKGYWEVTRVDKTIAKKFKNGGLNTSYNADTAKSNPNKNYYVLSHNFNGTPSLGTDYFWTSFANIGSGLNDAEIVKNYTIVERLQGCLGRSVSQYLPPSDSGQYKANINVSAYKDDYVLISLAGKPSMNDKSVRIYWGNGQMDYVVMDSLVRPYSTTYNTSGNYTITIMYPERLAAFQMTAIAGNSSVYADTALFNNLGNISSFVVAAFPRGSNKWEGDVSKLGKVEKLHLVGSFADNNLIIGGDISELYELKDVKVTGNNTLTGSIDTLRKLTYAYFDGENTVSGSTDSLFYLQQLEGMQGDNTITGNEVSDSIKIVCLAGDNTLNWDITNKYKLGYLSAGGYNSIHGSVTNDTLLYYIGVGGTGGANITGSLSNLKNLSYCYAGNYDKPTRFINNPKLAYFESNSSYVYSSAEINQLLSDLWTNRDVPKVPKDWRGQDWAVYVRYIDLRGNSSSQAPTGQGLIDLQNLRNYVSPPGNNVWTILTR